VLKIRCEKTGAALFFVFEKKNLHYRDWVMKQIPQGGGDADIAKKKKDILGADPFSCILTE